MEIKLKNEILKYFKASIIKYQYNNKDSIKLITDNYEIIIYSDDVSAIDLFIYLYNEPKKYIHQKATFNHNTQPERFEVLNKYYQDNNFSKFRINMNKLLRDSYYLGHPNTFNY